GIGAVAVIGEPTRAVLVVGGKGKGVVAMGEGVMNSIERRIAAGTVGHEPEGALRPKNDRHSPAGCTFAQAGNFLDKPVPAVAALEVMVEQVAVGDLVGHRHAARAR